jgi:hypothetical protein
MDISFLTDDFRSEYIDNFNHYINLFLRYNTLNDIVFIGGDADRPFESPFLYMDFCHEVKNISCFIANGGFLNETKHVIQTFGGAGEMKLMDAYVFKGMFPNPPTKLKCSIVNSTPSEYVTKFSFSFEGGKQTTTSGYLNAVSYAIRNQCLPDESSVRWQNLKSMSLSSFNLPTCFAQVNSSQKQLTNTEVAAGDDLDSMCDSMCDILMDLKGEVLYLNNPHNLQCRRLIWRSSTINHYFLIRCTSELFEGFEYNDDVLIGMYEGINSTRDHIILKVKEKNGLCVKIADQAVYKKGSGDGHHWELYGCGGWLDR